MDQHLGAGRRKLRRHVAADPVGRTGDQDRLAVKIHEQLTASAGALEILHRALVLLSRGPGLERAEIAAPSGLRILLARIEAIAGFELADHGQELLMARAAHPW